MTSPIGTPDWQRTQPGASKVIYANAAVNAQSVVVPVFFCGTFSSIAVYMQLAGFRYFMHPHFYTDASQAIDLGGEEWLCEDSGVMSVNVPVRAPWAAFSFGRTTGVGALTGVAALIGINSGTDASVMRAPQPVIEQAATPVGAGVTVSFTATKTIDGPALWTVHTTLATWDAVLTGINLSGSHDVIARMNQDTRIAGLNVPLPYGTVFMTFTNNTAAAGTVDLSLYAGRN